MAQIVAPALTNVTFVLAAVADDFGFDSRDYEPRTALGEHR